MWQPVYLGIGSNLNDPLRQVRSAIEGISKISNTRIELVSELVRSAPLGNREQPDYVNAVAALLTKLSPELLLDQLQAIERSHGRTRNGQRWESRTLDLDILVFGNQQINSERLTVPHPQLHNRSFVMGPLFELAPDLRIVGLGTVRSIVAGMDFSDLRPLSPDFDEQEIDTD